MMDTLNLLIKFKYFPKNELGFRKNIINGSRMSMWLPNQEIVTAMEFVLQSDDDIKPGETKNINILVLNSSKKDFIDKLFLFGVPFKMIGNGLVLSQAGRDL